MLKIDNIKISSEILKLISEIEEFKGKWQATQNLAPDRLSSLRRIATIESVGSSTRIEGAELSNKEVDELLSGLGKQAFKTRDEQEVAGYADAMAMVFESHESISVTENHIKQLHRVLLTHSTKDENHRGKYKTVDNSVEAFDAGGKSLGVVFKTATPFDTPALMKALVDWYNEQTNEDTEHPLVLIAIFINVLLAVHPFKDGNGRLSRILTTLLLLKSSYLYVPYSSMETVIEENKESYYRSLRHTQITIWTDSQNWEPWILFFLKTLVKQKERLSDKLKEERQLQASLPALSRAILDLVQQRGEVTVKTVEEATQANRNTVKVHLRTLVESNYLVSHGKGRGVWYNLVAD